MKLRPHPFVYCVLVNIGLWVAVVAAAGLPAIASAQPAGGGWQQCASGNGEACNLAPSPDLRQLVTVRNNWNPGNCVYGELEEQNTTLVVANQSFYYQLSSFDYCFASGVVHDGPSTLVAYVRTLHSEPEPGEYECTATICMDDALHLSWAVFLTWALAWGIRRLTVFAAGDAADD